MTPDLDPEIAALVREAESKLLNPDGIVLALALRVQEITREADAVKLEGFTPETTIFPATRAILKAAAKAIREGAR